MIIGLRVVRYLIQGAGFMQLTHAYSALVHPLTGANPIKAIIGAVISPSGPLNDMVQDVFSRAPAECDMELIFAPDPQGRQNNECRDELMAHARCPSIQNGEQIARRLQSVTPARAGSALLFILVGLTDSGSHRLVVSRFPAEVGVRAQEDGANLSLEFIEQVFLKNAHAYKCACFETDHLAAQFPGGRATDRQARGTGAIANYWLGKFLQSRLKTTDVLGTQFLAQAIRDAVGSEDDLDLKNDLMAASRLIRGMDGKTQSAESFLTSMQLQTPVVQAITSKLPRPEVARNVFTFTQAEYDKLVRYESVELDNGAILTAEHGKFETAFERETVGDTGRERFTTEGVVKKQRVGKVK